jgi:hypothetical protein
MITLYDMSNFEDDINGDTIAQMNQLDRRKIIDKVKQRPKRKRIRCSLYLDAEGLALFKMICEKAGISASRAMDQLIRDFNGK